MYGLKQQAPKQLDVRLNETTKSKPHLRHLLDGVDAEDGDAVSRHDPVAEEPVDEELHVPRHLAVRDRVRSFLQLQDLEVVALDLVWHDEERVERTFRTAGLKCSRHVG